MSRIVLITESGEHRIECPLPKPINDNAHKMTRWDTGDLQVEIAAEMCHDAMGGESFGSSVVTYWKGKVLRGCGVRCTDRRCYDSRRGCS